MISLPESIQTSENIGKIVETDECCEIMGSRRWRGRKVFSRNRSSAAQASQWARKHSRYWSFTIYVSPGTPAFEVVITVQCMEKGELDLIHSFCTSAAAAAAAAAATAGQTHDHTRGQQCARSVRSASSPPLPSIAIIHTND